MAIYYRLDLSKALYILFSIALVLSFALQGTSANKVDKIEQANLHKFVPNENYACLLFVDCSSPESPSSSLSSISLASSSFSSSRSTSSISSTCAHSSKSLQALVIDSFYRLANQLSTDLIQFGIIDCSQSEWIERCRQLSPVDAFPKLFLLNTPSNTLEASFSSTAIEMGRTQAYLGAFTKSTFYLGSWLSRNTGLSPRLETIQQLPTLTDQDLYQILDSAEFSANNDANTDSFVSFALINLVIPWCGHCAHFSKQSFQLVYETFIGEDDLIIAEIDATKYPDLIDDLGVNSFPTLFWWNFENDKINGNHSNHPGTNDNNENQVAETEETGGFRSSISTPKLIKYQGDRSSRTLVDFVNKQTGTQRALGGGYLSDGGTIRELSELLQVFMSGQQAGHQDLIERVSNILSQMTMKTERNDKEKVKGHQYSFPTQFSLASKRNAASLGRFYIKNMKRVLEKGGDFPKLEAARLMRILDSGRTTLSLEKKRLFQQRINIANHFVEARSFSSAPDNRVPTA